jgi:hypothetical protein
VPSHVSEDTILNVTTKIAFLRKWITILLWIDSPSIQIKIIIIALIYEDFNTSCFFWRREDGYLWSKCSNLNRTWTIS